MKKPLATFTAADARVRVLQDANMNADFPFIMERHTRSRAWVRVDAFPSLDVALPAAAKLFVGLTTGATL